MLYFGSRYHWLISNQFKVNDKCKYNNGIYILASAISNNQLLHSFHTSMLPQTKDLLLKSLRISKFVWANFNDFWLFHKLRTPSNHFSHPILTSQCIGLGFLGHEKHDENRPSTLTIMRPNRWKSFNANFLPENGVFYYDIYKSEMFVSSTGIL